VATVTETALTDDVSAPGAIGRSIDWGDGVGAWEAWPTGTVLTHEYPATLGVRYQPRVRLEDAAGNTATLLLRGVVIGDEAAPTGTFTARPVNPWAKLNQVTLTQSALDDNFTPNANIERLVDWGDGAPTVVWSSGTVLRHLYTVGGTFTPTVSLADEAFNQRVVVAEAVTVRVDTVKPTVRLRIPKALKAVRSWDHPARPGPRRHRHRRAGRPSPRGAEAGDPLVRLQAGARHLGQGRLDQGRSVQQGRYPPGHAVRNRWLHRPPGAPAPRRPGGPPGSGGQGGEPVGHAHPTPATGPLLAPLVRY